MAAPRPSYAAARKAKYKTQACKGKPGGAGQFAQSEF